MGEKGRKRKRGLRGKRRERDSEIARDRWIEIEDRWIDRLIDYIDR